MHYDRRRKDKNHPRQNLPDKTPGQNSLNKNPCELKQRSVSGTSGGRRITNTLGPLSDIIEVAATIIHNLHFTKPIACDQNSLTRSVARFVFLVFRFESGPRRQFFQTRRKR